MKKIIIASLLLVTSIAIAQSMRSRSGYVDGSHLEVAISKENLADSQWDEKAPLPVSIETAIKTARERVKRDYPNVEWEFIEAALVKRTINRQPGYFYQVQFKETVSEEEIPKRVEEGRSRMQDAKISILLNSTVIPNKKKDS